MYVCVQHILYIQRVYIYGRMDLIRAHGISDKRKVYVYDFKLDFNILLFTLVLCVLVYKLYENVYK